MAIDLALGGDAVALRLCLERLLPPRKDRPITFAMPPVTGAADHPAAIAAVLAALALGELTPTEAEAFSRVLGEHRKAIEAADFDARLRALEERHDDI